MIRSLFGVLFVLATVFGTVVATADARVSRKAPQSRVAEAFTELELHPWRPPRKAMLAPRPYRDHWTIYRDGKLLIYRECGIDRLQDPAETSCRPSFAAI